MTIGDKIKYFRKKLEMSQEELGQKLFVSRQTISLWEKGQTVPTLDNLIRLKEIFGVSVDEILDCEAEIDDSLPLPTESYKFTYYTDAELMEISKHRKKNLLLPIIFFSFLTAIFLSFSWLNSSFPHDFFTGFAVGLFIFVLIYIYIYIREKKNFKNDVKLITNSQYELNVYGDYFILKVYKDGELTKTSKVVFSDINQIADIGKTLLVTVSNQYLILRKEKLADDSVFYSILKERTEKKVYQKPKKKWKVLSVVLFIAALLSPLMGYSIFSLLAFSNGLYDENLWVYYPFLIIPLASVIFGFALKNNGYKYKKHIVIAMIMSIVLIVNGLTFSEKYDVYTQETDRLLALENYTGIDFPEHKVIASMSWFDEMEISDEVCIEYTTDVYFDSADVEDFEKSIEKDSRWLTSIPDNLSDFFTVNADIGYYDYALLYNSIDDEYNTAPTGDYSHYLVNVFYSVKNNQMKIVEYYFDPTTQEKSEPA